MKYALLYTAYLLIAGCSYWHYYVDSSQIVTEVFRLIIMGIGYFLFAWIIILQASKKHVYNPYFKAHIQHFTAFIIAPKMIEHLFSVLKVQTGISSLYDAYTTSCVPYIFLGLFILSTSIRCFIIKWNKRYSL